MIRDVELGILAYKCGQRLYCLLGPPLVGSGHQIVLMKDMSYGRACLMLGYVLLEDMSRGNRS